MDRPVSTVAELGTAVRDARRAADLTQAQLALRAGVSRQFVIDLERGARPGAELRRVLAVVSALGKQLAWQDAPITSVDDFLDGLP